MSYIETKGGVPTRGEAYTKLIYHLREAENQAYVISHLHGTEDGAVDKQMALLWQLAGENIARMVATLTSLATGNMQ